MIVPIFFLLTLPMLAQQTNLEPLSTLSVSVRMVEVHAAVHDGHGRPVKGLNAEYFQLSEDGRPQTIKLFETQEAPLTTALLVDTTGSMLKVLPIVKNAVANLLAELKPNDSIGVFSFSNKLNVLQPVTRDRTAALNALLQMRAAGPTALFDSLAQLARQMSKVSGKKAILVFTDGADNSSLLSMEAAIDTVKRVGIPVYCVAQGEALQSNALLKRLEDISVSTGAVSFKAQRSNEVAKIFNEIGKDLQNLYLLGYYPSENNKSQWHKISVVLPQHHNLKVRAKEGYWP